MPKKLKNKVVIIGCGNVAWHFAKKLISLNFEVEVYNHKSNSNLLKFEKTLNCKKNN
jgi:siroheme synthase (precorrin-2 oxidase/ferrochelatase)